MTELTKEELEEEIRQWKQTKEMLKKQASIINRDMSLASRHIKKLQRQLRVIKEKGE